VVQVGISVRFCKHGNETYGSTKGGEFLDWLIDYQLLKKDSASCN
jgi:hypothetical protein